MTPPSNLPGVILVVVAVARRLCGVVRDPAVLLVLRAAEGVGFCLPATAGPSLIRRLVPPARLASRLGLWGAYMPLGTALALLAGPLWMTASGWPAWWWLTGALSLLLAPSLASASASPTGAAARVAAKLLSVHLVQTRARLH